MSQEQIFNQVYEAYKNNFPEMKHGSGGLPDTKGDGTSDVDICLFHKDYASLGSFFPEDTEIDSSSPARVIYKLKGYEREVNVYCSDGGWWQNGYLHRKTELALNAGYPELALIAYQLKKHLMLSTEETWAKVLNLGENYFEILLDTEQALEIAKQISVKYEELKKNLPK
jgi:hypothetical protein